MKYIANPVEVDAFKIVEVLNAFRVAAGAYQPGDEIVAAPGPSTEFVCVLDNGDKVHATPEMCSRMTPAVGDYWVIQSDGYVYLNPKDVFERKYRPLPLGKSYGGQMNASLDIGRITKEPT